MTGEQRDELIRHALDCAPSGLYLEAIRLYREASVDGIGLDVGKGLAFAQLKSGDAAGALATLDAMPPAPIQAEPEWIAMLRVDVLAALNRKEDALDVCRSISPVFPSEAARRRYIALMLEMGHRDEALRVLETLERRLAARTTPPNGSAAIDLGWAMERLTELRSVADR